VFIYTQSWLHTVVSLVSLALRFNKLARYHTPMSSVAEHGCFSDTHNSQEQHSPLKFWSYLVGQAAQYAFRRAVVTSAKKVVVIDTTSTAVPYPQTLQEMDTTVSQTDLSEHCKQMPSQMRQCQMQERSPD